MDLPSTVVFDYPSINHLTQRILMLKTKMPRQSTMEMVAIPGSAAGLSTWYDSPLLPYQMTSQCTPQMPFP